MTLQEAIQSKSMSKRIEMMKSITKTGLTSPETKLLMIELRAILKEEMQNKGK